MDEFKTQITATEPTVIRPNPPAPGKKPSHAEHPEERTSRAGSAATFTETAAPGEQLLLALPAPEALPAVEKIRDAVNTSYKEKRALLAVLSAPMPGAIRAIDLQG